MADARTLLRAERASRRITHPHASYTGDGKLLCNLCETLVKSEAHWQSHLHSTQHNLRSQRQQDAAATRKSGGEGGAKKRKAESIESPPQERKKAKAEPARDVEAQVDGKVAAVEDIPVVETTNTASQPTDTTHIAPNKPKDNDINTDDIAAFERELATLEANAAREEDQVRQEAVRNAATISAAPMTAEELASQAREEQSAQRGKRDVELEDEREDAARVLEEELEEMEGLEERVRKLRERREWLRVEGRADVGGGGGGVMGELADRAKHTHDNGGAENEGESNDEDDDDEDFDEWKFGGS